MRALLIVNPYATSTTASGRDALVQTLSAAIDLQVVHTTHRGHAAELASTCDVDLVVVHGGDGTVNEVVNGLLPTVSATATTPPGTPTVAVIPGGSANVFARSLGIDADPQTATAQLVERLAAPELAPTPVGLGIAHDPAMSHSRWFLFNSGLGVDAATVRAMEVLRASGKAATPLRYLRETVRAFFHAAGGPPSLTVELPGADPVAGVYFAFVSNSSPYSFFGDRPIHTNPGTSHDTGLGIFASRSMSTLRNLPLVWQMNARDGRPDRPHLLREDDVACLRITSDEPIDFQVDGDYLGTRTEVSFGHCRAVLPVVTFA